jgi:hypothetical protein
MGLPGAWDIPEVSAEPVYSTSEVPTSVTTSRAREFGTRDDWPLTYHVGS